MCRLVAYMGHKLLLEDVLVKPSNSLIMQSLHAKESHVRTNGDGFGLGWYVPHLGKTPGLFTSISPAWNDRNLLNLCRKIESPCFFAHVRSASAGGVTTYNCHPFVHGEWMFMHNGTIHDFILLKRHLRHLLDDDIYHWIQGETDSEHLFALFLQLAKNRDLSQIKEVAAVFMETLKIINGLSKQYSSNAGPSYFNVCLTNGKSMLVSRYCNSKRHKPDSLHYLTESSLIRHAQRSGLKKIKNYPMALVASERLSAFNSEWFDVPANHFMLVENYETNFIVIS